MWSLILSILAILIALVSLITSIYFYYANKDFSLNLHNKNQSTDRINKVVDAYLKLSNSGQSSGVYALIKSGIASLYTEEEAIKALDEIKHRTSDPPLGGYENDVKTLGILKIFKDPNLDIKKEGMDKIILKLKNPNSD